MGRMPGTAPERAPLCSPPMTREVQGIPPAPRRVRWRSVVWYAWPLCFLALLLSVYGGVFDWMLFLAYSGKARDNERLDTERTERADGRVTRIEANGGWFDDLPAEDVEYEFHYQGQPITGRHCFAPASKFNLEERVEVVVLPGDPHISRIEGTRLHLLPFFLSPGAWLRWVVLPGCALLLLWFALVLRLRATMSRGDVAVAELQSVRRLRFVLPTMLSVSYSFRDHHAAVRKGRHWVPLRSPLGLRLEVMRRREGPCRMPVVHSRSRPGHNRLAIADDFVRASTGTADLHPLNTPEA